MMDLTSSIIAYKQGELTGEEQVELFQALVDNGMVWTLQGHYGRVASAMIDAGLVIPNGVKTKGSRRER
jgi:hypothetical protein